MDFPRDNGPTYPLYMPASAWTAGGKLRFSAKPVIDDDLTDSNAVINVEWGDEVVTDVVMNGIAYKKYACYFPPSSTLGIQSNGAESADYLADFKFFPVSGPPMSFPPKSPKITATVWFGVTNEVS